MTDRFCLIVRHLRGACRHEGGASAIEFALLAPFLLFAGLTMVDLGQAIYQKIAIDQSLRAGFEVAVVDPGPDDVAAVVANVAGENFDVSLAAPEQADDGTIQTEVDSTLYVGVSRYCACPSTRMTSVSCTSRCDEGATPFPYAFYSMEATKQFAGLFLPEFELKGQLKVQVQ